MALALLMVHSNNKSFSNIRGANKTSQHAKNKVTLLILLLAISFAIILGCSKRKYPSYRYRRQSQCFKGRCVWQ